MKKTMPWMFLIALLCLSVGLTACGSDDGGDPVSENDASTQPSGDDDSGVPDSGGNEPDDETGTLLRVSVIDELTGRPVLGATVVANVAGASLTLPQQANERYEIELDSDVDVAVTVSVFHQDYNYVTVADVKAHDLVVALRRLPEARRGGITGTLTNWPTTTETETLAVGVAGLSLQGNILDFEPSLYLGDAKEASLQFPSWISSVLAMFPSVTLPDSLELNAPGSVMLGDKTSYAVLGLPSPCDDETAERAGTCGKQAAFSAYTSISGFLDPTLLSLLSAETIALIKQIIAMVQGDGELDIASLIPAALPLLPQLLSILTYDYAQDLSLTFGNDNQSLSTKNFTTTKKFDLQRSVTVPTLPILMGSEPADLVGVIALADLQSQGLLPLGAGASVSSALTFDMTLANVGTGLDSAKRKLIAIALDSDIADALSDDSDDSVALVFSALIGSFDSLPDSGATLKGNFLGAPAGSAFDGASRTLDQLPAVDGATLYRAVLKGADRRWVVYYGDESTSVTLPAVPAGFGDVISTEQAHTLIALRLPSEISFESLFADDATNADQLGSLMEAFSIAMQ